MCICPFSPKVPKAIFPVPLLCQLCRAFFLSVHKAYCDSLQWFRSTAYISLALLLSTWACVAICDPSWKCDKFSNPTSLKQHCFLHWLIFPTEIFNLLYRLTTLCHLRLKLWQWATCQIAELCPDHWARTWPTGWILLLTKYNLFLVLRQYLGYSWCGTCCLLQCGLKLSANFLVSASWVPGS